MPAVTNTQPPATPSPGGGAANPFTQPGALLAGKYRVDSLLGQGGMGVVVAATHLQLEELVAIKLPRRDALEKPERVERFVREARACLRITSEHSVRVMDVGTLENGAPYLAMEHLDGCDLAELLSAEGPLGVSDAVDYVLQAAEALAEAHSLGIIHRDLKPSNLFLTTRADGSPLVKVLDFGIAKALRRQELEAHESPTDTQAMMGSPMYMAPEQVRRSKLVDERTDVWGLGVILHELLTGAPPFMSDTVPGLLAAIVADPPVPLRQGLEQAPVGLGEVILRALEKDPNSRIRHLGELASQLAPFAPRRSQVCVNRIARLTQGPIPSERLPQVSQVAQLGPQAAASLRCPRPPGRLPQNSPGRQRVWPVPQAPPGLLPQNSPGLPPAAPTKRRKPRRPRMTLGQKKRARALQTQEPGPGRVVMWMRPSEAAIERWALRRVGG